MSADASKIVVMGRITGAFGIKGWVKVRSYTDPMDQIMEYRTWHCSLKGEQQRLKLKTGQVHGKGLIAKLEHVNDRNAAEALAGYQIEVSRDALPKLDEAEYYWSELIGLQVINRDGIEFGEVSSLIETGSNDVLVVQGERERLVPWILDQVIIEVSLLERRILVDWDADF